MEKIERKFEMIKATKNMYRFEEVQIPGEPMLAGQIYIHKHWFLKDPKTITVSVE